jgi:surface protein
MSDMFQSAGVFNRDLSSWDVSSVLNMGAMFWRAAAFNRNLCSWGIKVLASVEFINDFGDPVFQGSGCPLQDSPNADSLSAGPWCQICSPTSPPTEPPPTMTPLPTLAPTPIEFINLVLDDPPFEIPFLPFDSLINFVLTSRHGATRTTVTCETEADNGDVDLYMKEGERPTVDQDALDQEVSFNPDSHETATLTPLKASDVYVLVHAFSQTSNATVACCRGEGPCS